MNNPPPTVHITETDPGDPPLDRPAATWQTAAFSLENLKLSRAELITTIQNSVQVPRVWQNVILAAIDLVPAQHDLLRLDLHCHPIGAGVNVTFTLKEL